MPETSAIRGRGIALMHAMADDVEVDASPTGTVITLTLAATAGGARLPVPDDGIPATDPTTARPPP